MDFKTILIIALIGYMVFWYTNPDKGMDLLDKGVEKTQALIGLGNCPSTYDPVCGIDGITYNNSCIAQKAGLSNLTLGVCS